MEGLLKVKLSEFSPDSPDSDYPAHAGSVARNFPTTPAGVQDDRMGAFAMGLLHEAHDLFAQGADLLIFR